MIGLMKFKADHYQYVQNSEPSDILMAGFISYPMLKVMESYPHSYTLIDGKHKIVGCAGVYERWPGNAMAWATLETSTAKRCMLGIHRKVQEFFDATHIKRIETIVEYDFEPGHRWAKMLGFTEDAHEMKHYYPNGKSVTLYARIK